MVRSLTCADQRPFFGLFRGDYWASRDARAPFISGRTSSGALTKKLGISRNGPLPEGMEGPISIRQTRRSP